MDQFGLQSSAPSPPPKPRWVRWLVYAVLVTVFFLIMKAFLPFVWRLMYYAGLLVVAAVLAALVLAAFRKR